MLGLVLDMTDFAPLLIPNTVLSALTPLDDALAKVRAHLDMPLAYLSEFDGDDVVCRAISGDDLATCWTVGHRQKARGSLCAAVRDGLLPQLVADLSQHTTDAFSSPCGTGIGAFVAIPILLRDGRAYGTFCCLSRHPVPGLNLRDHAVVQSCAARIGEVLTDRLDQQTQATTLRQRISDVIADRDFQMLLQPIVDLETNMVTGAEALCRFRPIPYRSPDAWFAEAGTIGLRAELERAVLQKALEVLPDLPMPLKLSVNVSPCTMALGDLTALVDGPFSERIIIELTNLEGCDDLAALQKAIRTVRDLGVEIAVDEIAANHASFRTVMQLKPDIVKLDRDLVRGLHLDPANQALAAAVIHFSNAIGAKLIAGGIERAEEAKALRALGISQGQGYLIGRPGGLQALVARMYSY